MPTFLTNLLSAPATAVIDQNNVMTLSWQPAPDNSDQPPDYSKYAGWNIYIDDPSHVSPILVAAGTIPPIAQTFTRVLSAGDHSLNMKSLSTSPPTPNDSPFWTTVISGTPTTQDRNFPGVLGPSDVSLDNTTLLLGQQLNVTLSPIYTTANQWQVIWPDGTNTGWLPLTASVVAKAFTVPGPQTVVVQSRYDYTGAQYDPPATLVRSLAVAIFVMDQEVATNNAANQGLSTTLGFGGTEGFELIDTSVAAVTPEPWEAIARGIVRDTNTNELKMVIAATRFQGGSSLLGTLAMDVFPIEGRPHSRELIQPVFELVTGPNTTAVPVKIQTTTLPDLIVGKSINDALGGTLQMTVKNNTGIPDFLWTATNLPPGVFLGTNGVLSGTPLQLGQFSITFAVQDSGSPFSIDEITLPVTVKTDMKVIIAAAQHDANNTLLVQTGSTLGVAQVNKPYSVQMQVGNINPNIATAGGLAPYKWSIPAGALPVGLTIDQNTGLISGVPSTYNSTTDFSKTYTAVVQVTDAIGAKASTTYTMTLEPAVLTVGDADQSIIYATQDFKLAIPVFGGTSPYTLLSFNPASGESGFYTSSALVDGQIEIVLNVPASALGNHSFIVVVQDSAFSPATVTKSVTYNVKAATAATQLIKAFVNHYWFNTDSASATPISASGPGYGGFVLVSDTIIPANGINVTVDPTLGTEGQATFSPNWSATVAYKAGDHVLRSGVYYECILANTNQTPPNVTYWEVALPAFGNSEVRTPLVLTWAEQEFGRISRTYSLLTQDNANANDIGNIATIARPFVNGDVVGMNPRKPYFNSPATVVNSQPDLAGLGYTARIFPLTTLPPGLSLDANTGLIYGTLAGAPPTSTQVQYVDSAGTLHGTATITWQPTSSNQFSPIPTFVDGGLGTIYDADASPLAIIAPPGGVTLASVSAFTTLPAGLSVKINLAGNAALFGTPTEAGYFDIWYQLQSTSGQSSFVYQRLAIYDPLPFLIVTSSLPNISAGAYKNFDNTAVTLYATGGVASGAGQYTWGASDAVNGPWVVGGGNAAPTTGPFVGLSLAVATGVLSGTLTSPPGGAGFTDLGNITFTVTDARTAVNALFPSTPQNAFVTISKDIDLTYTGSLIITNPNPVGLATFVGFAVTGVTQNSPLAGQATYAVSGTITNPSNYVGKAFTFSGFVQPGNNVTGTILSATSNTLVIANGGAVTEGPGSFVAGMEYGWFVQGAGGNAGAYVWSITAGGLPAGLSLNASTGEITGALTTLTPVNPTVTFSLTDTVLTATPVLFNVTVGEETILVTTSKTRTAGASPLDIDAVNIGTPYLGALLSTVTHTTNAAWQQAPTSSHSRLLTTDIPGLRIMSDVNSNSDDNGETGTIAGLYTGASFSGHLIRVVVVDSSGNTGSTILNMNTGSTLAITDSSPLPNATATISYSYTFHGVGGLTPYAWTVDPATTGFISSSSFAFGGNTFTLNSSTGQLTSTVSGSAATNSNVVIKLTDAALSSTTATFSLSVQPFGLVINGPFTIAAQSGRVYNPPSGRQLTVSGVPGTDTIVWSVSGGAFPTGLSLSAAGVVSGTTNVTGFNQTVTIRATDTTLGSYKDQAFTVTVTAGLTLQTGIDSVNGLSTLSMGYVDNGSVSAITPRPNQSFIVFASGVVSTNPGAILITTSNPNITATVTNLDTVNGIATITLTGSAFDVGVPGVYTLSITVVDSGVTVSGTFTWTVYDDGVLRLAPGSGNFPQQLISGQ